MWILRCKRSRSFPGKIRSGVGLRRGKTSEGEGEGEDDVMQVECLKPLLCALHKLRSFQRRFLHSFTEALQEFVNWPLYSMKLWGIFSNDVTWKPRNTVPLFIDSATQERTLPHSAMLGHSSCASDNQPCPGAGTWTLQPGLIQCPGHWPALTAWNIGTCLLG